MVRGGGAKRALEAAWAVMLVGSVENALENGPNSSLLLVEVSEVEATEEYL